MGLPKINSVKLAKYLLATGGPMSHLKLQKMIYYVEGCHLAILEEPLITDHLEAWMHGPVAPAVWHHFKNERAPLHDSLSLEGPEATAIVAEVRKELTPDQIDLIGDV